MQDTREEMLSAAAEEFLERGYAAATMASIAGRLSLTKGALAHHFPAKQTFAEALSVELRTAIHASRARAEDAYPQSASRAMVAFLLALGNQATSDTRVAAAVSLLSDRAAPSGGLTQALDDLLEILESFATSAQASGELSTAIGAAEVAEHLLVTNLGTAFLARHKHIPEPGRKRLRFIRLTLKTCGMPDADVIVDDVLATLANNSLASLPLSQSVPRGR